MDNEGLLVVIYLVGFASGLAAHHAIMLIYWKFYDGED